jgi:hypothetical protein
MKTYLDHGTRIRVVRKPLQKRVIVHTTTWQTGDQQSHDGCHKDWRKPVYWFHRPLNVIPYRYVNDLFFWARQESLNHSVVIYKTPSHTSSFTKKHQFKMTTTGGEFLCEVAANRYITVLVSHQTHYSPQLKIRSSALHNYFTKNLFY